MMKIFKQSDLNNYELIVDNFYNYSQIMTESLNKSNIQKISSNIIIDYLKKSS